MSSPFDMITHSPIMQLANLAKRTHYAGAEPDSGQERSTAPNDGAEPR